jgi:tetratricopeptide (TPR) repeat protein
MSHNQLNRIIGLAVFLISLIVYGMTVASTTSYWDCGEFITCAHILGVPHPPGAPLYILVGRLFTLLPFFEDIGLRVNIISVLVSAFTVMFTYLIIVRLLREWRGVPEKLEDKIITYTGGVIGALGFAFSSSFWFNAVEAEVYAVSMFFTAIVVWLILVWSEKAEDRTSDKILLLILYLFGLATGVHLLNILAIFTIGLIIYFKKYRFGFATFVGLLAATSLAFGAIYPGIVKGIPLILKEFSFWALGAFVLALFVAIYYAVQNQQRVLSMILMGIMLVVIGYSTYTAIYIRSGLQPAINENNPNVPARLVSYLNREQYGDIPITERRAPLWEYQIKKMYIRYFGWQFIGEGATLGDDNFIVETFSTRGLMGLPFLVGLIGMFYHFNRDWKRAFSILTLFFMTGVAISIYLNQEDPQPRERDYAYVGSFFAFALWIGIGASAMMELVFSYIRRSQVLRIIAGALTLLILFLAVPYNLLSFNYHKQDRTGNYVAYDYSYNILQTCEPDAILFTNGDNDTFPLWFLQYVYNIRRDVRVVNLSLLNTDWYIKQLRDEEPKVPIAYNDREVNELQAILWQEPKRINLKVPREKVIEHLQRGEDNTQLTVEQVAADPAIQFEMRHTKVIQDHPVILVQDRMVLHIIAANKFERPIYFAVTVSPENMLNLDNRANIKGLENYLRMDGLAFKVTPYGGPRDFISPQKLHKNLFEEFRYRNLNNPEVYYNDNILGLLQNYRSAFLRLANYYQTQGKGDPSMNEKALAVLDKMNEVMPEEVIPLRNYQLSLQFGRMYAEAGRPQELEKRLQRAPQVYKMDAVDMLFLAEYYSQFLRNDARAESLALEVLKQSPQSSQPYGWLMSHYARTQQYDKSVDILQRWLNEHPTDKDAKARLEELQVLAHLQDSLKISNKSGDGGVSPPKKKP